VGRLKTFLREWGLVAAVVVVLLGAYLYLRTPAGSLTTWDELQGYVGTGRPVLVEVYSNT
jgi:hypothetical protein